MTIITQETIIKTRQWFANNQDACIAEVANGSVKVNDIEKYVSRCIKNKSDFLDGIYDHGFTFIQRAQFIQTGESVPLFAV